MDETQFFQLNQLQLLGKVGNGAFGEVFKAKEKNSGQILAVKISIESLINKEEEEEVDDVNTEEKNTVNEKHPSSLIRNLVREVNIMSKFNHPSIVKFIGFSPIDFSGENKPVIITEFLSNGTLKELIDLERHGMSHEKWNDTRKLIIIYGIASAMQFLHSHKIIHRDLKPENIMMDDELYPKVVDFGLSKITHTNMDSMSMNSTKGVKGTMIYLPPESLFECEYTKATDVYAFGMIVYEIMTNEKPFGKCNFTELISNLMKGKRPEINDIVPESYKKLIMNCWEQEASNRPTFDDVINKLKEDSGFITETIDEDEYYKYIDYIDEYEISFSSGKPFISVDEFMRTRKRKPREDFSKSDENKNIFDDDKIPIPEDNIGLKLIQRFARNGDLDSMKSYASLLYSGLEPFGVHKKEAAIYFKKAADLDDLFCIKMYAKMLIDGDGIPMDKVEGARYLKMAADKDDTEATFEYARMLYKGNGIPRDVAESSVYLKKAADNGIVNAMLLYASILKDGKDVPMNKEEALHYYKMAAEKDNIDAMMIVGMMLLKGDGVPADRKESTKYYKMAIEKGSVEAMYIYGISFFIEENIESDKKEGLKYIKMAADNGHVAAMRLYAQALNDESILPPDGKESIKYIKKAIENGDVDSMFIYAQFLYQGKGVKSDKEEAAKYFKMAADNGNVDSMKVYAQMLEGGIGVPVNEEEAKKYIEMAKNT